MSDQHSFSVPVADLAGVDCAVVLNKFEHWHRLNMAAGNNLINGRYWTYNKLPVIASQFSYFTEKQVRTILFNLEKNGLLITAHHGGNNRTTWYTLGDAALLIFGFPLPTNQEVINDLPDQANANAQTGESNCPNGQMQMPDQANANAQTGECIYKDTITDTVTDQVQNTQIPPIVADAPTVDVIPEAIEEVEAEEVFEAVIVESDKKQSGRRPPATTGLVLNIEFEDWYEAYDKKRGRPECEAEWRKLTDEQREQAMQHTLAYVVAVQDKQFRKDPIRYLKKQSWTDEIIQRHESAPTTSYRNNDRNGHHNKTAEFGTKLDQVFANARQPIDCEEPF